MTADALTVIPSRLASTIIFSPHDHDRANDSAIPSPTRVLCAGSGRVAAAARCGRLSRSAAGKRAPAVGVSTSKRGVRYELLGEGTPVVLTSSGWFDMERMRLLAEALVGRGCRILIYDRSNCGQARITIDDSPSEIHLWCEELHLLVGELGLAPAYFGGYSMGTKVSLHVACRYERDVEGLLLLYPGTHEREVSQRAVSGRYEVSAAVAEQGGMDAVIAHDGWAANWRYATAASAENRRYLGGMDPEMFAATIRRWQATLGNSFYYGLTRRELESVGVPTLIVPGLEEIHPPHMGEWLTERLANGHLATLADLVSAVEIARFGDWPPAELSDEEQRQLAACSAYDRYRHEVADRVVRFIDEVGGR